MTTNNNYVHHLISILRQRSTDAYLIRYGEFLWQDWFFSDIDLNIIPHAIYWTQSVNQAYKFDNEIDAKEFAGDFITPRIFEVIGVGK